MSDIIKKLTGKVALVTGASRGLGVAIAHALADEGADVAISYVASAEKAGSVVRQLEAKGVRAAAFQTDQGDPAQAEPLIQAVVQRLGRLDILVNNAAVAFQGKTIDASDIDNAQLDRMWTINVAGVIANIREAAKLLPDGGRIVTIGSGVGHARGISRRCRLCRNQSGGGRILERRGARSGSAEYHCQCGAGRFDGHRHGRGGQCGRDAVFHAGNSALWPA
jgi:NAD(P)-dependent dehydrogenase (short-subunit alcohol dehydrogenase family)